MPWDWVCQAPQNRTISEEIWSSNHGFSGDMLVFGEVNIQTSWLITRNMYIEIYAYVNTYIYILSYLWNWTPTLYLTEYKITTFSASHKPTSTIEWAKLNPSKLLGKMIFLFFFQLSKLENWLPSYVGPTVGGKKRDRNLGTWVTFLVSGQDHRSSDVMDGNGNVKNGPIRSTIVASPIRSTTAS